MIRLLRGLWSEWKRIRQLDGEERETLKAELNDMTGQLKDGDLPEQFKRP